MAHWIDDLEELCEKVTDEIAEVNKKIRNGNGKLSAGDVEYLDKLTHTLKSIKTTIAMGAYDDDYSRDYMGGNSYARNDGRRTGNSRRGGNSYARKRDSMGRYSRDEARGDMIEDLRELMEDAPDMHTKQEFERFIAKLEKM